MLIEAGKLETPPGSGEQSRYFTPLNRSPPGGFRVNASLHRQLNRRKRRILRRIENKPGVERHQPMMAASNVHYQIADRTRAIAPGGIGAIHLLARKLGLVRDIDESLHLLKRHMPYFESDHVLNIAYNLLAGGSRIEHLEVRRNDEVYLDALGAERIPDPTTAGVSGGKNSPRRSWRPFPLEKMAVGTLRPPSRCPGRESSNRGPRLSRIGVRRWQGRRYHRGYPTGEAQNSGNFPLPRWGMGPGRVWAVVPRHCTGA